MDHPNDVYGDSGIESGHGTVPAWLKWSYLILPIWGIIWFGLYWNGAQGWLDRGGWYELEQAANTTMPSHNAITTGLQGEKDPPQQEK